MSGAGEREEIEQVYGAGYRASEADSAYQSHLDALAAVRHHALGQCLDIAEAERRLHDTGSGFDSQPAREAAFNIAAAIRTLTDGGHDA